MKITFYEYFSIKKNNPPVLISWNLSYKNKQNLIHLFYVSKKITQQKKTS